MKISNEIKILIRTSAKNTIVLLIPSDLQITIKSLKEKITGKLNNVKNTNFNLFYQGNLLVDSKKAKDYHFTENCEVRIEIQAQGGEI